MCVCFYVGVCSQAVVLADKPVISDDTNVIDPHLLDVLLANISTLASVFHKPPEAFVSRVRVAHEGACLLRLACPVACLPSGLPPPPPPPIPSFLFVETCLWLPWLFLLLLLL